MSLPAIRGFDWDHGNRDKCQKHGMSIGEIEGGLYPARRYLAGSGDRVWRASVEGDRENACRTPRVHRLYVAS
jgi:hypothetical protein